MNHSSQTALDLDHVLHVIGYARFAAQLNLPVTEWDLTADDIERLRLGPHHARFTTTIDTETWGFAETLWAVTCDCGLTFSDRLLSAAMRDHDDHAHHAHIVVRPIHTAEMLEA